MNHKISILLAILLFISGCSTYEKHIKKPIKGILIETINISIRTDKQLNINSNMQSSPLEVIIFETDKKVNLFKVDDYLKIENLSIEKHIFQPESHKDIEIVKKKNAKFINIIANYQKNNDKNWLFSEKIELDKDTKLMLLINDQGIKKLKE